jgi:hypothetical protein
MRMTRLALRSTPMAEPPAQLEQQGHDGEGIQDEAVDRTTALRLAAERMYALGRAVGRSRISR